MLGINAKTSEFNAVMGLCNLKYIDSIISDRNKTKELYDSLIGVKLSTPKIPANTNHNHAYYPVLFTNERLLLQAKYSLEKNGIYPRRYFYPSLNNLKYIKDYQECPVSEDYASRILCLPIYYKIKEDDIRKICQIIN
jgi:dTDP-4-amino-4,6-dideoxygalactose transaminase